VDGNLATGLNRDDELDAGWYRAISGTVTVPAGCTLAPGNDDPWLPYRHAAGLAASCSKPEAPTGSM